MKCSSCGNSLASVTALFCSRCGAEQNVTVLSKITRQAVLLLILAIAMIPVWVLLGARLVEEAPTTTWLEMACLVAIWLFLVTKLAKWAFPLLTKTRRGEVLDEQTPGSLREAQPFDAPRPGSWRGTTRELDLNYTNRRTSGEL